MLTVTFTTNFYLTFRFHDPPWLHSAASASVSFKSTYAKTVPDQQQCREWRCIMCETWDTRLIAVTVWVSGGGTLKYKNHRDAWTDYWANNLLTARYKVVWSHSFLTRKVRTISLNISLILDIQTTWSSIDNFSYCCVFSVIICWSRSLVAQQCMLL